VEKENDNHLAIRGASEKFCNLILQNFTMCISVKCVVVLLFIFASPIWVCRVCDLIQKTAVNRNGSEFNSEHRRRLLIALHFLSLEPDISQ